MLSDERNDTGMTRRGSSTLVTSATALSLDSRCPRASVGRASFLTADRLPVVIRFPAGPRVSLKTVDPPKGNGLAQKKNIVARQQKNGRDAFAEIKRSPSCTKPDKSSNNRLKNVSVNRPATGWWSKALVEDPDRLISEITAIRESKQATLIA